MAKKTTQPKTSKTPKKDILREISNELDLFDFSEFDPRTDKELLMTHLQSVNSKLGSILRIFENETT